MSEEVQNLLSDEDVEIPRDPPEPEVKDEKPEEKPEVKEDKPEKADPETKYRNVSKALKEERARLKAIEAEREQYRRELEEARQLKSELQAYREEQRKKREEEENKLYQENPAEFLKQRLEQTERRLAETEQQRAEREQMEAEENHFRHTVVTMAHEFATENHDYHDAFNFVKQECFKAYEALGVPAHQYEQAFNDEAIQLARNALGSGRNPAEVVYALAKARGFGSTPKVEEPAENKIEALEKAHKKNQSLTGAAASSSFLKKIEDMNDEEFDKFWATEIKPSRIR